MLYRASSPDRVSQITHGVRLASFLWVQSMVRDDGERETLFGLDQAVPALAAERGRDEAQVILLTSVYHNLVRRWAETRGSPAQAIDQLAHEGRAFDDLALFDPLVWLVRLEDRPGTAQHGGNPGALK